MSPYKEAEKFLYERLPMFQRIGGAAYRNNLDNIQNLSKYLGHPEKNFKTIHVAGTNGKGSTCHFLASIMQEAGYTTGLFTSPHLKSFRERIKINGVPIEEEEVVNFVNHCKTKLVSLVPSFFEMTTAMAFNYFAKNKVDVAIIETGMGGRLDSTNIIEPVLSVITSISFDHTEFLGNTLEKIAYEKAGIIKNNIPVVISLKQNETESVFRKFAIEKSAEIYFAEDFFQVEPVLDNIHGNVMGFKTKKRNEPVIVHISTPLNGVYQAGNIAGVLQSVNILNRKGFTISEENIRNGFLRVYDNTSLQGRWQKLGEKPMLICDVAHNEDGIKQLMVQVSLMKFHKLFIVFGMVKEKDCSKIFMHLPKDAFYLFCEADIPRAKPAEELAEEALKSGLNGEVVTSPAMALNLAKMKASDEDLILVTGSTFVVGEILTHFI